MAFIYLQFGGTTLVLGFLISLVTGCASFQQMEMPPLPENLPVSYELTAVPFFLEAPSGCIPANIKKN